MSGDEFIYTTERAVSPCRDEIVKARVDERRKVALEIAADLRAAKCRARGLSYRSCEIVAAFIERKWGEPEA